MKAAEVIQQAINRKRANRYLEIGVFKGKTFSTIQVPYKIAVDPRFKISWWDMHVRSRFENTSQHIKYHKTTSRKYFATCTTADRVDVVFIDGLHTYGQGLKDVYDSLKQLNPGGVIIMHDCNPPHPASAHPAPSYKHAESLNLDGWKEEWCGDVWKVICHIRSFRHDLNVFTLDCDFGLGVITRGSPESRLDLSKETIKSMTYDDFRKDRTKLLNIKPPRIF